MSDRLAAARDYVSRKPTDRFGLYALAMELRKAKAWEECFAAFDNLLVVHPDYAVAYYHYGSACKESGDRVRCLTTLRRGFEAATRTGDGKTRAEIEGLIDELEGE